MPTREPPDPGRRFARLVFWSDLGHFTGCWLMLAGAIAFMAGGPPWLIVLTLAVGSALQLVLSWVGVDRRAHEAGEEAARQVRARDRRPPSPQP